MRGPETFIGALSMAAVTILLIKLVMAIWPFLVAGVAALMAWAVFDWWRDKIAADRKAERQRIATLIEHADREHRLVQRGDVRGIYGEYTVPDECRGLGIWLCDPHTAERRRGEPQRRSRLAG